MLLDNLHNRPCRININGDGLLQKNVLNVSVGMYWVLLTLPALTASMVSFACDAVSVAIRTASTFGMASTSWYEVVKLRSDVYQLAHLLDAGREFTLGLLQRRHICIGTSDQLCPGGAVRDLGCQCGWEHASRLRHGASPCVQGPAPPCEAW